ncbi:MAG: hypothetical protein QOD69_807, partial [Solirubrobacteraceae bacterium]|nr:hypothetical protein [Solirubrobacteraceae bacterium]
MQADAAPPAEQPEAAEHPTSNGSSEGPAPAP